MDVVDRLIEDYGVGYFKVDYNVTMGYGSDLYADSCADAIRDHYLYLYEWYKEIFRKHPDLVIENCGSGGQRMDYGMLKLLSLQSTSDQTDYVYNSYIASNVASAVTPEQAGMWVYPYKDEREHVIYNMVNGLLLRPYMSGMAVSYTHLRSDLHYKYAWCEALSKILLRLSLHERLVHRKADQVSEQKIPVCHVP